jgi:hypothetical protein
VGHVMQRLHSNGIVQSCCAQKMYDNVVSGGRLCSPISVCAKKESNDEP